MKATTAKGACPAVQLVCLDFDGTVMVYDGVGAYFHADVIKLLNSLEHKGIRWCSNSGRDRSDQLRVLEASAERGLRYWPDALVCSESMVYVRDGEDYRPLEPWNSEAFRWLEELHVHVQARLEPVKAALEARYNPKLVYIGDAFTAYMLDEVDGRPEQFAAELEALLHGVPNWMMTRNGGWVAVLHEKLGKGNALSAYLQHRGIESRHVLAVGDQFNDLNMLDGEAAGMVGCPGNSIPEVQAVVKKKSGFVAKRHAPEGTLDVLNHFLT